MYPSPGSVQVAGVRLLFATDERHVQGGLPQGQDNESTVTMGWGCSGIVALS